MQVQYKKPPYTNLKDLKEAIDEGRLVLSHGDAITLDNDSAYMYIEDEEGEESRNFFDGGTPGELLRQALDLLGIPWEEA